MKGKGRREFPLGHERDKEKNEKNIFLFVTCQHSINFAKKKRYDNEGRGKISREQVRFGLGLLTSKTYTLSWVKINPLEYLLGRIGEKV